MEDSEEKILYLESRIELLEDTVVIMGTMMVQAIEKLAPGYREEMLKRVPHIKDDKIFKEMFECQ